MSRRSPSRHTVKAHNRGKSNIRSYDRGIVYPSLPRRVVAPLESPEPIVEGGVAWLQTPNETSLQGLEIHGELDDLKDILGTEEFNPYEVDDVARRAYDFCLVNSTRFDEDQMETEVLLSQPELDDLYRAERMMTEGGTYGDTAKIEAGIPVLQAGIEEICKDHWVVGNV